MIATSHTREEVPDGSESVILSLVEGAVYHFRGIRGPDQDGRQSWVVVPGPYRLIGVGRDVNTNQQKVAYRCLANNKMFFCTLNDWSEKFQAPKEEPYKVAGTRIPGITHAPNPATIHAVENETR